MQSGGLPQAGQHRVQHINYGTLITHATLSSSSCPIMGESPFGPWQRYVWLSALTAIAEQLPRVLKTSPACYTLGAAGQHNIFHLAGYNGPTEEVLSLR